MNARAWQLVLAAILALVLPLADDLSAAEFGRERIAVLVSHGGIPFMETLEGFRTYMEGHGVRARYIVYPLDGDPSKASTAAREAKRERPDLLFTIGALATAAAQKEAADLPIVTGMVLRAENVRKRANTTGVFLEHPFETQFRWLRRILPEARTVGVLYNPGENRERIEAAAKAARHAGFTLDARVVNGPQELPAALSSLSRGADALWCLHDSIALAPEAARHILLFSFRNRIPVVGLSASWVKAGALYSLEWDFADIGAQCGEIALRLLRGARPAQLPPASPRKISYSLNLHTARHMKIDLPEALVRGARQVFKDGE